MPVTSHGQAIPGGAAGGYTGGTGNWGSGSSPYSGGGGGASGTSPHASPPQLSVSHPKEQVFKCIGRGLKPNTVHRFFYENIDRTVDCSQLNTSRASTGNNGRIGGPLTTDASGYIEFNFYFTATVEQEVDRLNNSKFNLLGDKVFELRAVDSTAKKTVPFSGGTTTSIANISRSAPSFTHN